LIDFGKKEKISPTTGLPALLAVFGRQAKAFEPVIPKGSVISSIRFEIRQPVKVSDALPDYATSA